MLDLSGVIMYIKDNPTYLLSLLCVFGCLFVFISLYFVLSALQKCSIYQAGDKR